MLSFLQCFVENSRSKAKKKKRKKKRKRHYVKLISNVSSLACEKKVLLQTIFLTFLHFIIFFVLWKISNVLSLTGTITCKRVSFIKLIKIQKESNYIKRICSQNVSVIRNNHLENLLKRVFRVLVLCFFFPVDVVLVNLLVRFFFFFLVCFKMVSSHYLFLRETRTNTHTHSSK